MHLVFEPVPDETPPLKKMIKAWLCLSMKRICHEVPRVKRDKRDRCVKNGVIPRRKYKHLRRVVAL